MMYSKLSRKTKTIALTAFDKGGPHAEQFSSLMESVGRNLPSELRLACGMCLLVVAHCCYRDEAITLFIPITYTLCDVDLVLLILKYPRNSIENSKLTQVHGRLWASHI